MCARAEVSISRGKGDWLAVHQRTKIRCCVFLLAALLGCNAKEPLRHETTGIAKTKPAPPESDALKAEAADPLPPRVAAPGPPRAEAPPKPLEVLYIQLLGKELPPEFLENMAFVKKAIEAFYRLDVTMLPVRELPEAAWYAPRRRYRAERLLDFLEHVRPSEDDRILGITTWDISTTKGKHKDWGILGLATLDGKVCVVSTHRTGSKKSADPRKKLRARYRFAKTVVHELGHNFGLEHCPNTGCLMEDAKGTVKTTDREYTFCDTCRQTLEMRFSDVAVKTPEPPWPRPEVGP